MKELFKQQLETNKLVTEETLEKIKIKAYKNGDEIKTGDKILYAFLTDMSEELLKAKAIDLDGPMVRSQEPQPISLELIILNENQFDLYTYDARLQNTKIGDNLPIIRLK
jgi:hypothetical protein